MIVLALFREDHSKREPLWRTCDSVGEKSVAHILELNSKESGVWKSCLACEFTIMA
jgi:hypothetical protein